MDLEVIDDPPAPSPSYILQSVNLSLALSSFSATMTFFSSSPDVSTPPNRFGYDGPRSTVRSTPSHYKPSKAKKMTSIPRPSYNRTPGVKSSGSSTLINTSPPRP
jgi:hypothetical protein